MKNNQELLDIICDGDMQARAINICENLGWDLDWSFPLTVGDVLEDE